VIGSDKVLGVVPARGGSKGVPRKNVLMVGGKPLVRWTIDAALRCRYIDRLILSSDDSEIIDVALQAGCEVPFRREPALATDESTSVDVVIDAVTRLPGFEIVVLLQPTSPLRSTVDIDSALELLVSSGAPSCVSLREAEDHPFLTYQVAGDGRLSRFANPSSGASLRRQDLPAAWTLNGAIYIARTDWLIEKRTFVTGDTVGFRMPLERSLDVDTLEDIECLRSRLGG
jgi:N-acylneuraminate cytidylyltransferase